MKRTSIMLNGMPGNVAQVIARAFMRDERFNIIPYSLTGPDIDIPSCIIEGETFELIRPENRDRAIVDIKSAHQGMICVDYTHPTAVNTNADFYCHHRLPFVMGTTGGDRLQLTERICSSDVAAVIAPNMAKQIVGLQALMAYGAEQFPDLFKGYRLSIRESHQTGKADTSGTAKAMVGYFNCMGIPFKADQIEMERDPERQLNVWGIPADHLQGHAWHTYTLTSADSTVVVEFKHNVNGREVYAEGTRDAVVFLNRKIADGARGMVYSMIDVLKEGALD